MFRITNDNLGRALHSLLHTRFTKFCETNTPEVPPEVFVNTILQRLYNNDPTIFIFVELKGSDITAHAIIDYQELYGARVMHCYQYQRDKPSVEKMNEFMEMTDKLCEAHNVTCQIFSTSKNVKAYQKYGYNIARTVMVKLPKRDDNDG